MIVKLVNDILPIVINCSLPGIAGGIVLFLWALKNNHYHNNKFIRKFSIELLGAMLTATFITMLFKQGTHQVPIAFIIGIGWSGIIQMLRTKVTKIIEAALGEKFK